MAHTITLSDEQLHALATHLDYTLEAVRRSEWGANDTLVLLSRHLNAIQTPPTHTPQNPPTAPTRTSRAKETPALAAVRDTPT